VIALATALALAAASPSPPTVEREIEAPRSGRLAVDLDRDVYDAARLDLGDLRVVDESGAPVPYFVEHGVAAGTRERRTPRTLNRSFLRSRAEIVTLDFGERLWKSDVTLSLAGDNFRRRVVVEASNDGASWTTLTDEAYVFAVPGPPPARYEQLALPENDARFLRLAVHHGDGDPERIEIREASARTSRRRAPTTVPIPTRLMRHEDAQRHETLLTLDLGARAQPFQRVEVEVADARFLRGVVVEARRDPPPSQPGRTPPPIAWAPLGEGCLYRYEAPNGPSEALSLPVGGRERAIRLRILNRDDRPLDVRGVTVLAPRERLFFEASAGRRYRLTYGAPGVVAPSYDFSRTMGEVEAWAVSAATARLGTPVRRRVAPPEVPWTDRHPAILWTGLVFAAASLGALTWRALRTAG